jgi:hypothetical protein
MNETPDARPLSKQPGKPGRSLKASEPCQPRTLGTVHPVAGQGCVEGNRKKQKRDISWMNEETSEMLIPLWTVASKIAPAIVPGDVPIHPRRDAPPMPDKVLADLGATCHLSRQWLVALSHAS